MKSISVCIPSYKRPDLIMETINPLICDSRIDEIILCDDDSPYEDYEKIFNNTKDIYKIRLIRNVATFGNQHNKRNALSFARNEWVMLLDNDNVAKTDLFDKIYGQEWDKDIILHPDFAYPRFSYTKYANMIFSKENISENCYDDIMMTLLNTNNYFVNRDEYLRVYKYNNDVKGADGIYFAYNWFLSGNKYKIVDGMRYEHRVHDGSCFLSDVVGNMTKIKLWFEKVKQLK